MNLASIDLNLLLSLDALLVERNVTRAADRVGLSQPAMSHALGRLRKLFDDPILVRTSQGMMPTPRALALLHPIHEALQQIESALAPRPDFSPKTTCQTIRIAATDYVEFALLPMLIQHLTVEAPGINLEMFPLGVGLPEEKLLTGEYDLVLGCFRNTPSRFHSQRLFEEQLVCMVREDHPEVSESLSLEQYLSLNHALISQRGRVQGLVDALLEQMQLQRRVGLTIPHFLLAPFVIAQTDYIITLAKRVAERFETLLPLRILEPPLPLSGFCVTMVWHERTQGDPALQWFRALLEKLGEQV